MTTFWAESLAAGVDDEVFWGSTLVEVCEARAAYEARREDAARRADMRAGVVAAQVVNMAGRRAKTAKKPKDFFRYSDDPKNESRAALLKWAHETPGVTVQ